ncbi:MAG: ABC transporter substrate-binding protein [Deltaproteobacteria bacterium]
MKIWKWLVMMALVFGSLSVTPAMAAAKNEVKIARYGDIQTLDPAYLTAVAREFTIDNCIYNGLVKYDEGSWKVVPDLATSWDISPDGKEITFHLRKGVQFQKGFGEMTAEDVKFSVERIINPKNKSPEKPNMVGVKGTEVVDKYTVKIILDSPNSRLLISTLPMNAGFIVSKKAVEKMGRKKFAFNPVGTGPYEFVSWDPGKKVVLKSFNSYWGEKPEIKKVVFVPIPNETTCETALKTGEIDVGRISLINLKSFEKNPALQVVTKPDLKYWWSGYNFSKAPTDNIKLRKALRASIDVSQILQAAFYGVAPRARTMVSPGVLGYWKDAPMYRPDLAKARELLKEGGKPDGFKATIQVYNDITQTIAEVAKADAAKVGIDLEIVRHEPGAFNKANQKGTYNLFIDTWSSAMDAGYTMGWFIKGATWNVTHWENEEFDRLLTEARKEMDPAKRAPLYQKAQEIMDQQCFAIWLTHGVRAFAADKDLNLGKVYPNGRLAPWTMNFNT